MLSPKDRQQVRDRAAGRCEYCGSPVRYSPDNFSVEHIIPRSAGGTDALDNLAWSCQGCNGHKFTATTGLDAGTGDVATLFNPRRDQWSEHFAWSQDSLTLIGISATGRVTVARLQLNRDGVTNLRRLLVLAGEHPPPLPTVATP